MPSATEKTSVRPAGRVLFADASAAALLNGRLDMLTDPQSLGFVHVKQNASRTVYRGSLDGQNVYLKQFHSQALAKRLAQLLGLSDALGEFKLSRYLQQCGVRSTPVLAVMCGRGGHWLLSRAVEPAEPAGAWHAAQLAQAAVGRQQIRLASLQLAEMIARMHAAGVLHDDLHCGNILVSNGPGGIELTLMDLHRAVRRRRLSRRSRAANLAQLLHDRMEQTTLRERLWFLRRYLEVSQAGGTLRLWQRLIEDFARRHRMKQYRHADRRITGVNRYFSPIAVGSWTGRVILASKHAPAESQAAGHEFHLDDWRNALGDIESLMSGPAATVVKDSPSVLVVRRSLPIGDREVLAYIKRPRRKQAWKIVLDCFRPSRPRRAFCGGHALLNRQIATALPLAYLERRVGPFVLDSVLITEGVEGWPLEQFITSRLSRQQAGQEPPDAASRRRLTQEVLRQMGLMLQHLHDNGFAHRDMKVSNIYVSCPDGVNPRLTLLDLDALRTRWHISTAQRFQGLMRLNVALLKCPEVSHAGRLRVLLSYLHRTRPEQTNFKPYWRHLERWSSRKLRRQIRSLRKRQKAIRRPTP